MSAAVATGAVLIHGSRRAAVTKLPGPRLPQGA
jgi:hypothetical protein